MQEAKIAALENMAIQQTEIARQLKEQADQMIIQSGHMQYEANLMSESNKLLEKQIDLQTTIYLESKDIEAKKIELEQQKRLSSIRPYFYFDSTLNTPPMFGVELKNRGKDAYDVRFEEVENKFVWFFNSKTKIVITNESFFLKGCVNEGIDLNPSQVSFSINLKYKDIDGNDYFQVVKKLPNDKYTVSNPVLQP